MNSSTKLMAAVMIEIYLSEGQRNRSSRLTSLFCYDIEQFQRAFQTSSASSWPTLFIFAIRFSDLLNSSYPFFSVNSGDSSTTEKAKTETRLGMRIKKAKMYFQSSMRNERREMSETPREKAIWMAMIILPRVLPRTSSLKKQQWMVRAALAPNPSIKLPTATMKRLTENSSTTSPAMQTIHEINSPFFLPRLSLTWAITTQPKSEPRQLKDCSRAEIHSLEQTMVMPQSRAMDLGTGCWKWLIHFPSSSLLQTKSSQVSNPLISSSLQVKPGTMQKKLREKRIMAAITHFSAIAQKSTFSYFPLPRTSLSSTYILFSFDYNISIYIFLLSHASSYASCKQQQLNKTGYHIQVHALTG